MPDLINPQTGEKVFVPPDKVGEYRQAGFQFEPGKSVKVLVDGQLREVTADDADILLKADFAQVAPSISDVERRQENLYKEEFESPTAQISSLFEGFGRTLTLGGTDVANRLLGQDPFEQEQRRERNTTSTVGELAGLAPALLIGTGEATLASKLLPAALATRTGTQVKTAVGGIQGAMIGGATEGALYGTGQAISNLALSNKPLTTEAIASEVGWNVLLGGGLGTTVGAVEGTVTKLARNSAARRKAYESLETTTKEFDNTLTSLDSISADLQANLKSQQAVSKEADRVYSQALLNFERQSTQRQREYQRLVQEEDRAFQKATKDYEKQVKEYQKTVENIRASQPKVASSVDGIYAELRSIDDEIANRVSSSANTRLAREQLSQTSQLRQQIENTIKSGKLKEANDLIDTYEQQLQLNASFLKVKEADSITQRIGNVGKQPEAVLPPEPVAPVRRIIATTEEVSPPLRNGPEAPKVDPSDLVNMRLARQTIKNLQKGKKPVAEMDFSEAIVFARALDEYQGTLSRISEGLGSAKRLELDDIAANLQLRVASLNPSIATGESASNIIKMMATAGALDLEGDLIESIPVLGPTADSFLKFWLAAKVVGSPGSKTIVEKVAKPSVLKRIAARSGGRIGAAVGRSGAIEQGYGRAIGDAAGYVIGSNVASSVIDSVTGKAQGMALIAGKAQATVERASKKFKKVGTVATRSATPTALQILNRFTGKKTRSESEAIKLASDQLMKMNVDSMDFGELAEGNEEVSELARQHFANALMYLAQNLPVDPRTNPALSGFEWTPSKAETMKFARILRAVMDPLDVIERASEGGLISVDEAEAIRATNPAILEEFGYKLLQDPEVFKKMSRQKKLSLSILLDVLIGVDLNTVTTIQKMYQLKAQENSLAPSGNSPQPINYQGISEQFTDAQQRVQ